MTVDYYNILKVSRTTGEEELRRAYKKLAVRWHPDKHPSVTKVIAEAKFKQICEAYDALSDPNKRQIYDLYGEDGLRYNVSSPSAATAAARGGGGRGESFRERDIFDEFLGDGFGSDKSPSPKSDNGYNYNSSKSNGGNYYRSNSIPVKRSSPLGSKAAPIENKLGCTLEELYKGSKRKMVISRIVPDDSGKPSTVEEVLAIDIKPGWKKGTKITFPDKGNQESGLQPGDLIFVIDEKPHLTFQRDGNDLVVNEKISLVEALTGKTVNLTTLDGRNLNIEVSDIVKPGHEVVIPGEGMPISKDPRQKGNLKIKFDVKFPSRLSSDQKADIKRVLSRRS
ncbi:hypothetical protein KSS87_020263 [Heliosperma pusillum]|nr:hypothetical protein KSS87_020263 [Heliosperma pusillum]